jgi:hypothetical protein
MTHQDVDDAAALLGLLAQIPADQPIATICGDGAYDTKACHKIIAKRGAKPLGNRNSTASVKEETSIGHC